MPDEHRPFRIPRRIRFERVLGGVVRCAAVVAVGALLLSDTTQEMAETAMTRKDLCRSERQSAPPALDSLVERGQDGPDNALPLNARDLEAEPPLL